MLHLIGLRLPPWSRLRRKRPPTSCDLSIRITAVCGNVMQRMVAIQYLHGLTHIDGNHMRKVLTASLLDLDRNRRRGFFPGQAWLT